MPSTPSGSKPEQILNLPNFLTLCRICAIPAYLVLLSSGEIGWALLVFAAAGITDSLDGAIARLTDSRTTLGAYLDPLADKALIVSSFVALSLLDAVPGWLTVVVLSRDVLIVAGYLTLFVVTQELMEVRPSVASKATTFLHLCSVSVALVSLWRPEVASERAAFGLFFLTAALTTISGVQYVVRGLRWYSVLENAGRGDHRAS